MSQPIDDRFEEWANKRRYDLSYSDHGYIQLDTQGAHEGFIEGFRQGYNELDDIAHQAGWAIDKAEEKAKRAIWVLKAIRSQLSDGMSRVCWNEAFCMADDFLSDLKDEDEPEEREE